MTEAVLKISNLNKSFGGIHATRHVDLKVNEADMYAAFALADRISVMVHGEVIATGAPNEIRPIADVRQAYLGEE